MRRAGAHGLGLALGLLSACATPGPGTPPRTNPCEGKVAVEGTPHERGFSVVARNDCHVAVALAIQFPSLVNLRASRPLPVELELPPGQSARVVELELERPGASASYRAASSVRVGGTPRPDAAARYAFPFGGGEPRELSQGVDGAESHQGAHRHSFDFDLPIGTPVLAARDGVVFHVIDGYGEGGPGESAERGNAVVVWHEDGTFALYAHLREGIPVREGQRVAAGERIAWSGNSGYSTGPHLHFAVGILGGDGRELETIPIRFAGDVVPEEGRRYGPEAERAPETGRRSAR